MEMHSNTDMTNRSLMGPERIPSSQSAAEAVEPQAGLEYSTPESNPPQKLRREPLPAYQYSPLADESDDIRILDLLPGERDDPILIRLQPCSLSNRPSYEAISYAWGSKTDNAGVIVCEGVVDYTLEIPKSLHAALKQLRHHSDHRFIWADSICMNQADDQEKSHQVRLMRKIYQRADMVLIWLGNYNDIACGANSLFELINQISQHGQAVPPAEDRETWTAIERFFKRPWFERLWCLQEAVLSPSAKVMFGKHSTSWEHFGLAADSILRARGRAFLDDDARSGLTNAALMYLLSQKIKRRRLPSFLNLLVLSRLFKATDPRDKIYGILGIPTTDSDPDASELFLQPDYTMTLSEVYIQCALTIIQKTQSPRILSQVQHLPGRTDGISVRIEADNTLVKVPSWVPRWHHFFQTLIGQYEGTPNGFDASASMSLKPGLRTEVRGLELVTYGARITSVISVSRIFDEYMTSRNNAPETANQIWVESSDHLKSFTTNPTDALYALSILLCAGKDWQDHTIEGGGQHFADFLAFMYNPAMLSDGDIEADPDQSHGRFARSIRKDGTTVGHPNLLVDSLFRPRTDLALPPVIETGQANCFHRAMLRACTNRRLVVTEDGHIGLGSGATEPGDVVCILGNAPVPLLLRPEAGGHKFKLVGEAYIQGMMFGEITISEPEQIVLSDKPFVDISETEPRQITRSQSV